jgi:hypothetical protein
MFYKILDGGIFAAKYFLSRRGLPQKAIYYAMIILWRIPVGKTSGHLYRLNEQGISCLCKYLNDSCNLQLLIF